MASLSNFTQVTSIDRTTRLELQWENETSSVDVAFEVVVPTGKKLAYVSTHDVNTEPHQYVYVYHFVDLEESDVYKPVQIISDPEPDNVGPRPVRVIVYSADDNGSPKTSQAQAVVY